MNKTEAGLLNQLSETVTRLNNLKVPIVVGWVKGGKELKTMGSRHLTNKFESEFRNGRGWERAFDEDKTEMMGLPDNFQMPPFLPKNISKMNFDDVHKYLTMILKQYLQYTKQVGKGTGQKFSWGNAQLKIE